uniref:Ig-like domain-containing protein n=1 Tax=Electrophorus electricus TaxID=8005 RepID=A0AAY5EUD4_ELEEL
AGEAVTLSCTFSDNDHNSLMVWYKQRMGEMPQEVVNILTNEAKVTPEFHSSGIKLERISNGISLTIPHMKIITFSIGTFLTVKGNKTTQTPNSMVPQGESVSLQCTVLSERRTAELRVLWFRAAAGDSHPEIIYTHHNSSHQCEISSSPHSCVYNLSKGVLSFSDTGTYYYCSVTTCGKILLGNRSTVVLSNHKTMPLFPHDAEELNYAAIHFNERKTKRAQVKRGQPEDRMYSEVKSSALTDYHLDY